MDAITGFVYGMSMMFFSMMAWMFWRKGSDRLFRLIMILMLIVDAQCLKDILSFYFTGFGNEENWFLISAADMRKTGSSYRQPICLSYHSTALC